MSHKKAHIKKATAKLMLAGVLSFGTATAALAQVPTPPQGPPGGPGAGAPKPPPSPVEVFDNIFKKKKKTNNKLDTKVEAPTPGISPGNAPPAGGPPSPPNPLNLFKKNKKGGSVLPPPPKAPGA